MNNHHSQSPLSRSEASMIRAHAVIIISRHMHKSFTALLLAACKPCWRDQGKLNLPSRPRFCKLYMIVPGQLV